jgi:sulfite exporter TauE/SafE
MVHVVSGPDHLAAVGPLAMEQRTRAWAIGLCWGLGHASTVILVGILCLWLRELLPLAALSSWAERLVGIALVAIGLWGIRRALSKHVHAHEHAHEGHRHMHIHLHSHQTAHRHNDGEAKTHVHGHAAFALGNLHGLAGGSHFYGVLPALAFSTTGEAVVYLSAYGCGTILAMLVFSWLMGRVRRCFSFQTVAAYRVLLLAVSVSAVGLGTLWLLV